MKRKCLKCDRKAYFSQKTLCSVHFSELITEAREARLKVQRISPLMEVESEGEILFNKPRNIPKE